MLSGPGQRTENEKNEAHFRAVPVPPMFCRKDTCVTLNEVCHTNSSTEMAAFPAAPVIAQELLMAQNFLDC